MYKHILFAIAAAVLLTAIVTVILSTVNAAYAVIAKPPLAVHPRSFLPSGLTGHPTAAHAMPMTSATIGAANNMTNATGNAANNMTGSVGQAKSSEVSIIKGASNPGITEPFNPSPLTVSVGAAVTWTNHDITGHTVTEGNPSGNTPANGFDSGILAPGKTFTHTFATAGAIQYYCTLHPTMLGEVIVK
jgi:plastocyanin